MARYIVDDMKESKYEKNYKMPLINIIPSVIWSIPFQQRLFAESEGIVSLVACTVFVIAYVALSYIPIVALMPAIAGAIILTVMLWSPVDGIDNVPIRIIVKIIVAIICGLVELAIAANATIPWFEKRNSRVPRIRKVD